MKTFNIFKYFALIALFGASTACSSDEPTLKIDNGSDPQNPNFIKRTPEQAIKLVRSLSENNKPASRSDESALQYNKVVDESSLQIIGNAKSRSGEPTDTLIYAVNYSNNDGFVLVSANANTEPILAIVDKGSFDENRSTDNESFEAYLNMAKSYVVNSAGGGGPNPPGPITPNPEHLTLMWKNDTIEHFYCQEPRIKVQWGQYWPANIYCPNKVGGCTPLAIAQALTLTRTIDCIDLQFPERDLTWTSLDWNDMVRHKRCQYTYHDDSIHVNIHMNNCQSSEKSHKDIGRLVRQLGVELHSTYYDYGDPKINTTSTQVLNSSYFTSVLEKYFSGKTIVTVDDVSSAFYQINTISINGGSIAILSAQNHDQDDSGDYIDAAYRHTWIADATALVERTVITYYNYDTVTGEYTSRETRVEQDDKYLHFNWGWDGLYDGYYLLNVFEPGYGYSTVTKDMSSPTDRYHDYFMVNPKAFCIK